MSTLKLPLGGGKQRKYHNGKGEEDKELTNFIIPKLNSQYVIGESISLDLLSFQICTHVCAKTHTLIFIFFSKAIEQQKVQLTDILFDNTAADTIQSFPDVWQKIAFLPHFKTFLAIFGSCSEKLGPLLVKATLIISCLKSCKPDFLKIF